MTLKLQGLAPLLQVFDMPASVHFYRDVMGFEVATTSPARGDDDFDWVLLRTGDTELMLNTAFEFDKRPSALGASRKAAHRDTGLFFGCQDLDQAYAHLRDAGISLAPPKTAPYGMRQLWLEDPDGYTVCLQWLTGQLTSRSSGRVQRQRPASPVRQSCRAALLQIR